MFGVSTLPYLVVQEVLTRDERTLEVLKMNGATDKQLRCIRVLCSKLGKPVPRDIEDWSCKEASEYIGLVSRQVDSKDSFQDASQVHLQKVTNGSNELSREGQIRLGLAAKLVHQQWALSKKIPVNGADDFKKEVVELYNLLGEVEEQAANGGGIHA